ncbi:MAG: cyclic nucleotide-binding domain-containing protein [Acidimicrobiales bacterium]
MTVRLRKSDKVERLKALSLFANCSRRELGQIAEVVVEDERPAGSVLTREGQDAGVAFVIVEGTAEVTKNGRPLAHLSAGDIVGELSLLDGYPRAATVTAATPLRVLIISREDMARLLKEIPELTPKLFAVLTGRIRQLDSQMADML